MPLSNGVPLPHEGRARYPLGNSHVVLIDLDDKHVVVEVHKHYLHELPEMGWPETNTFTLGAGDLRFFYYLKTPAAMQFLNSLDVRVN
jgi:hypothetical protein